VARHLFPGVLALTVHRPMRPVVRHPACGSAGRRRRRPGGSGARPPVRGRRPPEPRIVVQEAPMLTIMHALYPEKGRPESRPPAHAFPGPGPGGQFTATVNSHHRA